MDPTFQVPSDKLLNLSQLKSKSKPLFDVLKKEGKSPQGRKDLDPKWDASF